MEARFAADWETIWPERTSVGLAVSGGPDSLGLLLLAQSVIPGSFMVATVDHGFRPDSANEARDVASLCDKLGIRHNILTLALSHGPALQERARGARYAALGDWMAGGGCGFVAADCGAGPDTGGRGGGAAARGGLIWARRGDRWAGTW